MKRIAWILLPLGLGAVVLAGSIGSRNIEAELVRSLRETTGLEVKAEGKAVFSFLPRPQVRLQNVTLGDAAGVIRLHADALAVRGNLRLLALLVGHIGFDRIELLKPDILVDLDRLAIFKPDALSGLPGAFTGAEGLAGGLVIVHNGNVRIKGSAGQMDVQLAEVNFKFDWPQAGGPLAFNGRGRWRDVPFAFTSWLANPAQWITGGTSPMTLTLRSGQSRAAWRGSLMGGLKGQFAGDFRIFAPNLNQVPPFSLLQTALPPAAERLALSGTLVASARDQALSGLRLSLLGSDYEGALSARTDESGLSLSGTLATDSLLLPPALSAARQAYWGLGRGAETFGQLPLALDLRISAASAVAKPWQMEDVALAVRSKNGKLDLDLAEARLLGGMVEAHASLAQRDGGTGLSFSVQSTRIDLAALCPMLQCANGAAGVADGWLSGSATGNSRQQIEATLEGEGQLDATAVTVPGIDFSQVLRRLEKHSLPGVAMLREGQTMFDSAHAEFALHGMAASLKKAILTGGAANLAVNGTADLASRMIALEGVAKRPETAGIAPGDALQLKFKLEGPWNRPAFLPDLHAIVPAAE